MQRLKTRAQFQAVLAGNIVAKTPHFALHRNSLNINSEPTLAVRLPQVPPLFPIQDVWIGAVVPKRWAKRAVTRNAIKRQIYAVSAEFSHAYPQAAFVVRLRSTFSKTEFISAVSEKLKQMVRAEIQVLMHTGALAR